MHALKTLTLTAAALLGTAAHAGGLPSAIMFDGFCDRLTDIQVTAYGVVEGTYDLTSCATMDSYSFVGIHGCARKLQGVTGHYAQASGAGQLLVRLSDDGTWAYLNEDGTVFNSGTWTDASEGGVPGTRMSTQR